MALRLVEIVLPERLKHTMENLLEDIPVSDKWDITLGGGKTLTTLLLPAEGLEELIDECDRRYSHDEEFRMVLLPVEASIPRESTKANNNNNGESAEKEAKRASRRISREELYHDIAESAGISPMFMGAVVLSTVVAAVGLLRDNTAAIIGAMVIAPLLGPNAALALATTLADFPLARKAVAANIVGVTFAFGMSLLLGALLTFDPQTPEIAARTTVAIADIVIAVSAGVAGSLAFTTGVPTALIGVMVAVALLPPTVACGLLAGAAEWQLAFQAFLLLLINVVSVNLAGVATFCGMGIRPRRWFEAKRATRATAIAITIWLALLGALVALVLYAERVGSLVGAAR